jgi:hypothetical protein
MDALFEFLKNLSGDASAYLIAAFILLVWWVGRSFARLFRALHGGPSRLERPPDQERPHRRLPLI